MSELTVYTPEEVGGSVGSLLLHIDWRAPKRQRGVSIVDDYLNQRPWHPELLRVPLASIGVDRDGVLYWDHPDKGPHTPCSPRRVAYMLGLRAVAMAFAYGNTDREMLEIIEQRAAAYKYGYADSRLALAALLRVYRDTPPQERPSSHARANLKCRFRYELPQDNIDMALLLQAVGVEGLEPHNEDNSN